MCIFHPHLYNEPLIYITDYLLYISTSLTKSYLKFLKSEMEIFIFSCHAHNFLRNPFSMNTITINLLTQYKYPQVHSSLISH